MPPRFFAKALLLTVGFQSLTATATPRVEVLKAQSSPSKNAIPWDQIGVQAGASYQGDGLSVSAADGGARFRCDFQRMNGEATRGGLWLVSTVANQPPDRFRVTATAVGGQALTARGTVTLRGQSVQFLRPGLKEQYSVSIDGIRQDFLVDRPHAAAGELIVTLSVSGAKVEPAAYGAQLVLAKSGRRIAYSRVRAMDATGKELPAHIKVEQNSDMAVVVHDADAVYPVRIDPTFSDANWISLGGLDGTDSYVYAEVMDSSGNLYIGGNFAVVGNVLANGIAKWNGSTWSSLGAGMNNSVWALAVSGSNLYAGGYFTTAGDVTNANYVAQWNGSSWSALGLGMGPVTPYASTQVRALAVMGTNLYAGGNFSTAGGNPADGIAQWNGSGWSPVGPGLGYVYALGVVQSNLYAGGNFFYAGPIQVNDIARWNGSSWSALGSGMNGPVSAFAVSGTNLYVGGEFTMAGPINATNVALWNGSEWSALGSGVRGIVVQALAVSGTNLYAGGNFTTAGNDTNANNVAVWNGTAWSSLGSGVGGDIPENLVYALSASGDTLYAGGIFATAGGSGANNIAQWNGTNWSPLCPGLGGSNPFINAVAVADGTVYIGGEFITAGTNPAICIAQWNGSGWSALGSGMAGGSGGNPTTVNALAVMGSNLYAGGYFTSAGGVPATSIAQWNGTNWWPLGSGMGGTTPYVNALAVSGSTLYAGGYFSSVGEDASANSIAQWNGTAWSSLGSGMNSSVSALAVSGGTLYAGGSFTAAGNDTNADYIAEWDGNTRSSLDSGMNGSVNALAVSGSTLYASGYFTTAGNDTNANLVAQWDGSRWSSLGSGIGGYYPAVYALAVSDSTLYVGGVFTNAGGFLANNIAQWNPGSGWAPLGSGVNGVVLALAASGGTLYVGGDFTTAGTNVSVSAAEATIGGSAPVTPLYIVATNRLFGFKNGSFQFTVSGPAGSNATVQASTNLQTWISLVTNLLSLGSFNYTDTLAADYVIRFYRAKLAP
ncbi:MAG TPA: hypothetical protein VMU04_14435 [Candidatus Acidoferrum sp.]|nr:hypothetical protein [Candidatus Acidoferrum sp.]